MFIPDMIDQGYITSIVVDRNVFTVEHDTQYTVGTKIKMHTLLVEPVVVYGEVPTWCIFTGDVINITDTSIQCLVDETSLNTPDILVGTWMATFHWDEDRKFPWILIDFQRREFPGTMS